METKTVNEDSIFKYINPIIQKAMSFVQINETKRLIRIALHAKDKESIEVHSISEDLIFEKINPLIEESMNNEQKRETKRLIKLALPKQTKKVVEINVCFWFFKLFYITFYLGREKRDTTRKFDKNFIWESMVMIISSIFVFCVAISLVSAIFLALYYIKSLIGIDMFDWHLLKQ
mgnify:CR=1 FL=1